MPKTYPEGVFPGDRPEKRVARLLTYATFLQAVGLRRFLKETHVVLGGAGGDIELLLSLGVPSQHIVAAEYSTEDCERLRQQFPKVDVRNADVVDVVRNLKRASRPIGTLNLDFCNTLSTKTVEKAVGALNTAVPPYAFSITLFASREKDRSLLCRMEKIQSGLGLSSIKGHEKPISRAMAGFTQVQNRAVHPLQALRFLAYRAIGATAQQKHSNSSMSIIVGTTGKTCLPSRCLAVGCLTESDLLEELTLLSMQRRLARGDKNYEEVSP